MKHILFLLAFLGSSLFVIAQPTKVVPTEVSGITANAAYHDFGTLKWGIPVSFDFILTNDTKEPLLLTNAKGSCKCTKVEYSEAPVLPGQSTVVKAVFDGKFPGEFQQTVYVTTNFSTKVIALKIKGNVIQE